MATSSGRSERVYHQDYIARIRYSNALPPPPNPPKLLEIPNTGLASGQYTSAGFASRLAREQPLNIEADAELGMPIDLVGLPGVFDGDERVIQPLSNPPTIHPHDRALLRPLATLGKPNSSRGGVSFLRRTEYITSAATGGQRLDPSSSNSFVRRNIKRRRGAEGADDDPIHILRSIIKGFDLAYPQDAYKGSDSADNIRGAEVTPQEKEAWLRPKHPTKPGVTLLDSYPVLPDLDAYPDAGGYVVAKFQACPVPTIDKYDDRLDVGIIRPVHAEDEGGDAAAARQIRAYELFLPGSSATTSAIKRKFNVLDPDNEDPDLYDSVSKETGKNVFRYEHLRFYEPTQTISSDNCYEDSVVVALNDGDSVIGTQKGAYYYPIIQRVLIRPKRAGNIKTGMSQTLPEEQEQKVDVIETQVRDPDENETAKRATFREKYDPPVEV